LARPRYDSFWFLVDVYIFANTNVSPATDIGKNIKDRLIPLVEHLRHCIPLQLSTVFSRALLRDAGLNEDIGCHDLDASDTFFDGIRKK
jgi:hypothetical protein